MTRFHMLPFAKSFPRALRQSASAQTLLLSMATLVGVQMTTVSEANASCPTTILSGSLPCTISSSGSYTFSGNGTSSSDPTIGVYGGTVDFSNSGTLANTDIYGSAFYVDTGVTVTSVDNSGTMKGDYVISNYGTITSLTNSSQMFTTTRDISAIFNWNGTITTLTNSGTIAGGFSGIENYGTITTLYNTGTIGKTGGTIGIYNNNDSNYPYGTIENLHNSQQGLTYEGKLPTRYYVIVDANSSTSSGFGTLVLSSGISPLSGSMTVSISSASSVVRTLNMYGVISGISSSYLANYGSTITYTSGGVTYGYSLSDANNDNTWDLLYTGIVVSGPDVTNTTTALQANAISLRSTMDRRLTGLSMMTTYDCASFDKHGYCLSFQARYSNFDAMNDGSGIFTAAYKVSDTLRVGSFLDYRVSENSNANLKFSNDLPSFGLFAAYSEKAGGTGLQGKILGAVQHGNATITRSELTSTEPGAGKGNMDARLISGELGFGYGLAQSLVVTPYAGLRFAEVTRGSYTEDASSSVSYPIAYLDFAQRLTTATLGARVAGQLTDKIGYQIGAGIEHDLRQQTSSYSGTSSITGLTSFDLAVDGVNNRTRAFGSAGLFYQIDKTQRLVTNVSLRNQAYTAQNAASITGGYQIAF